MRLAQEEIWYQRVKFLVLILSRIFGNPDNVLAYWIPTFSKSRHRPYVIPKFFIIYYISKIIFLLINVPLRLLTFTGVYWSLK